MKDENTEEDYNNIISFVRPKIEKLSADIKQRHHRKYERDQIKLKESSCRNRRFRKNKRIRHNKIRKRNWLERNHQLVLEAKSNCPDQNAINLTNSVLSDACKSLLSKGPSFVPTPYDIDWYTLKQDFDNFVNKLRS